MFISSVILQKAEEDTPTPSTSRLTSTKQLPETSKRPTEHPANEDLLGEDLEMNGIISELVNMPELEKMGSLMKLEGFDF